MCQRPPQNSNYTVEHRRGNTPSIQIACLKNEPALRSPESFDKLVRVLAPTQWGHLWCVNLGGHKFGIEQLVRLRSALSTPWCMITHMYIDPQELPQRYEEPTHPNLQLGEAQGKIGEEPGGPWMRIFMALLRINMRKHNLYLFSEDTTQNSIIRLAVNNWYNPTSHRLNADWATQPRAERLVAHTAPGSTPGEPHRPTPSLAQRSRWRQAP